MTQPKFRLWIGGRFHYWGFVEPDVFASLGSTSVEHLTIEELRKRSQQFTGLQDKNSKEVYAGDIVRFDNTDIGGSEVIGEVIFNDDPCLSNLEWGLWMANGYHRTDFLGELEVLGSIYETPELAPWRA